MENPSKRIYASGDTYGEQPQMPAYLRAALSDVYAGDDTLLEADLQHEKRDPGKIKGGRTVVITFEPETTDRASQPHSGTIISLK